MTVAGTETSGLCWWELRPSPMGREAHPLRDPSGILGVPPSSSTGESRGPREMARLQARAH